MPARPANPSVLTRTDVLAWLGCWLVISVVLVATRFTSADPDSALYAQISARLADGPPARWIAPEWWGFWDSDGLFREHPAGVFFLPVLLGALGVPVEQAAYMVGVGAGAVCLMLAAVLISRVTSVADGRATLMLLQLMPIAFIFRIRSNHEYLMLAAMLALLVALDGLKRRWLWAPMAAAALVAGLLVKGVFVLFLLLAAVIWIACDPTSEPPARARQMLAMAVGLAAMVAVALWYDAAYARVTGETFWMPYWRRQMGQVEVLTFGGQALQLFVHVAFYIGVPLWHAAPWSLGALVTGWRARGGLRRMRSRTWTPAGRGAFAAVAFIIASIALLSPSSRYAERYIFAGTYVLAMLGAVLTLNLWPALRSRLDSIDRRFRLLPALTWLVLVLLRLGAGPFLPRPS